MKVLIDNGHGENTPGKCSPDRTLREYQWTREVAQRIVSELKVRGFDADLLTPEIQDVSLRERVRRVNYWTSKLGSNNVLCVSVHINAAGCDGKWHEAQGWSVFISSNASIKSKSLCNLLWSEASKTRRKLRRPMPGQNFWVKSLAMTRDTKCPSVLTENFFQDNREDCDWLKSEEGKSTCVRLHVEAIHNYIEQNENS